MGVSLSVLGGLVILYWRVLACPLLRGSKCISSMVGMPDVQKFFNEALAAIIAKLQYLYTRRRLSATCAFNVCGSYAHFKIFPYKFQLNENAKALCSYCTDSKGTNISVKVIQWGKLWYNFPMLTVSHYGEQAVSFKKVDLPKSL